MERVRSARGDPRARRSITLVGQLDLCQEGDVLQKIPSGGKKRLFSGLHARTQRSRPSVGREDLWKATL